MPSLFGRILRKRNRLYLTYEGDWLEWSAARSREWRETGTQPASTFPSFEEWLAAIQNVRSIGTTPNPTGGQRREQ